MVLLSAVMELYLLYLSGQVYTFLLKKTHSNKLLSLQLTKKVGVYSYYLYCFHAFGLNGKHWKLLILVESSGNLFEVHHVLWADEQQTETLFGSSGSSPTPMDISLRCPGNLVGIAVICKCHSLNSFTHKHLKPKITQSKNKEMEAYVVVDNMLHIGKIQSSCCHISS